MSSSGSQPSGGRIQALLTLLLALCVPPAALISFTHSLNLPLWLTIVLVLIYEILVFFVSFLTGIWQKLQQSWIEAIANKIDQIVRSAFSRYHHHYCRYFTYEHRDLDMKGITTQGVYTLGLEDVFVELRIDPGASPDLLRVPDDSSQALAQLPSGSHTIWEYLAARYLRDQHFVVLGPPGSGKTTLLKHLGLTLVDRKRARTAKHLQGKLPVLLFLRECSEMIRDNAKCTLANAIRQSANRWNYLMPTGWIEHRLARGQCLILLDGLDEVSDAVRQQTARWVERQMRNHSNNRFVLTSRSFDYRKNPLTSSVVTLEVQPLTFQQTALFVMNWYLANEIKSAARDDLDVCMKAKQEADDLLQRLRETPDLSDLVVSPLLLTMIATVHHYRGTLPGARVELYKEICEVFLGKRQAAKGLSIEMTPAQKQLVLQPLAYYMMSKAQRRLPVADALIAIAEPLKRLGSEMTGQVFLLMIEESSGLLLEQEPKVYSFAFFGLQEYLTALYIQENNLEHELATHMVDNWWHGTIYLYAEISRGNLSLPALRLAFKCLEVTSQSPEQTFVCLDHLLRDRVEGALVWLSRVEQRQILSFIARMFYQLMRPEENTTTIIQNLRETLLLIRPLEELYLHGREVVILLDLVLSSLECQSLREFVSQSSRQKLEDIKEPVLLPEMINFIRQLSSVQNQATKYIDRTDRREKELLLIDILHILDRAEEDAKQNLYPPYQQLVYHISIHWRNIIRTVWENQRGRVMLRSRLLNETYPSCQVVDVGIEVSNLGDETAEQVTLSISDSDDYKVVQVTLPLDYLLPGGHATLCCTLHMSQVRATRLVITLGYHQRGIDTWETIQFAYVLTFFDQTDRFPFVFIEKNPFVTGNPLKTNDVFFGREQLIADLADNLQGKYQDNPIVLYGQRRTGKTSLLYALKRYLPKEQYIPVFYNAEGVDSPLSLFWSLANQIYDACRETGIVLSQPTRDQYTTYASAQFENNFLRDATSLLGKRRLLLMIDEFESLEDAVKDNLLPRTIFSFLRKMMQHQRQLSFIFCGTHQLQELTRQYWQIFFNAALPFRITFLDENATKDLIQVPIHGHFAYDELALMRILTLTGGHPYFTQLLCHSIVSLVNKRQLGYVTRNEVDDVARLLIQNGNDHLDYIWNESGTIERALLLSLSKELQLQRRNEVFWDHVESRIKELLPAEHSSLDEARSTLERRELVTTEEFKISFTMGLIPEWLNTHYT